MATLYFTNLAPDCSDPELQRWVESHGLKVEWSRVLPNAVLVPASAFAYVVVEEPSRFHEIICALNGGTLDGRTVSVREVSFSTLQYSKT